MEISMLILKASKIHGVGVFTTTSIRKGHRICLFEQKDYKFRRQAIGYQKRYSIKDKYGWHGPSNFHRMSIGWYTNHSEKPNIIMGIAFAISTKYIKAGTELTLDYAQL
jgi:SET domain-containing protein